MAALTIQQTFEVASQHHQAGRLAEAEQLYRQILVQQPGHAGALHHLGLIAQQLGRNDIAVDLIRRAIALDPTSPDAHNNVGLILAGNGHLNEAIAAFSQAVSLRPNFIEAQSNLGAALRDTGQFDEAIAACRRAIALQPDMPEAHNNLSLALRDKGQLDEAIIAFRQAIALMPDNAEAHNNLGNVLREKGRLDEAVAACRQAVAIDPNYAQAHNDLGIALTDKGQVDDAIAAYRRALAIAPNSAVTHNNLGVVLNRKGQSDEAIAAYRRAIVLNPNYADACYNLGNVCRDKGHLDEAVAAYRQAIALNPNYAKAHNNLGQVLKDLGQLDEAIAAYRQAITLNPEFREAHSNLVFALFYHPDYDAQAIAREHGRWNIQHAEPLNKFLEPHKNERNPDRRLRIGYVSADFRRHSVSRFLLPLLRHHDHGSSEIVCYSDVLMGDGMTENLRAAADQWHSIVGHSDEQVAEQVRKDQIDILVDLAGHTAGNRLRVFARKPAPVQISYLGYPGATGLSAMDYRLSDSVVDPPNEPELPEMEKLWRLPACNWCYGEPNDAPPLRPMRVDGPICFGTFNNFAKASPAIMKLWSAILTAVPSSRLIIKSRGLGEQSVRQEISQFFQSQGVEPDRLEIRGREPDITSHLQVYHHVDIALDTFPYHGTTTTCEALWMGVPVITLAGQTHVSRVRASLLTNVGLSELIAESPEDYIRIAVQLANDLPRLRNLHSTLRQRMQQSPLMDAPRFARNVEAAYRRMWQTWCETAG